MALARDLEVGDTIRMYHGNVSWESDWKPIEATRQSGPVLYFAGADGWHLETREDLLVTTLGGVR